MKSFRLIPSRRAGLERDGIDCQEQGRQAMALKRRRNTQLNPADLQFGDRLRRIQCQNLETSENPVWRLGGIPTRSEGPLFWVPGVASFKFWLRQGCVVGNKRPHMGRSCPRHSLYSCGSSSDDVSRQVIRKPQVVGSIPIAGSI
jgi:hypothetical protein